MNGVFRIVLLAVFATHAADAVSNFRGYGSAWMDTDKSHDSHQMPFKSLLGWHQAQVPAGGAAAFDYTSLAIGLAIGLVVVGGIGGVTLKFAGGGAAPKEVESEKEDVEAGSESKVEGEDAGTAEDTTAAASEEIAATEEETTEDAVAKPSRATDYQKLLKVLAQKVAQEAGPKLSKASAVKNVLDTRMSSFQSKTKSFLLNEMNSTAGAVLKELDAPEAMMLLDWNSAAEANFPAASILIAGVLSPSVITLMSFHHFIQMIAVGLPIMILCICALYIDWAAPCAIPTIFPWLFTQTALAFFLVIGHGALLIKIALGKRQLANKAEELHEKHNSDDSATQLRDEVVDNTIILQEALLVENGIRHSFWNNVVGLGTFLWVITTLWNLFLICRYTFVPGIIAFHPDAAEVAKDDFCGAWMTVLVLRINILLAVLFLFFNLATVVQWVCDMMIESEGFQQSVIKTAREMDANGAGLPVVELLVKAFLLRGSSDTLDARLSVVKGTKSQLEREKAQVDASLAALAKEIDAASAQEASLKTAAMDKGGEIAEQVESLTGHNDLALWKAQGKDILAEKAKELQQQTTEALEELFEAISKAVEDARNSETAKALKAKYEETQAMVQEKLQEAMDTLQDEEFQKQLMDAAKQGMEQAQGLANEAMEYATDPEKQEALQKAMQDAMAKAQAAAQEVAAAAADPEKRKQLEEMAKKAMEDAQAAAKEAAAGINNEEMQKKLKEAAQQALDQAQLAAQSAIAAAQDPELLNKMRDSAEKAIEDAKKKLEEAKNDPKLKAAADKAMEEAKRLQQQAKAAASDVDTEMQKKLAEAAEKYQEMKK
jgi:hypothetical protein